VAPTDAERFAILWRSLQKFLRMPWRLLLVTPDPHWVPEGVARDPRLRVLRDAELLPELEGVAVHSWFTQQLLKLAVAPRLVRDAVLVLDADCFAVRPITMDDLVAPDGRVYVSAGPEGSWRGWYEGAAAVLGTAIPATQVQVTPFVFHRVLLQSLHARLLQLDARPFAWLARKSVEGGSTHSWTEYTLYHCWGEHLGLWSRLHAEAPRWLYGNSYWTPEQAEAWDARRSFENPSFCFSVAQSNSGKSAAWVWERVGRFLGDEPGS
jgi:hypothetical protein